MDFKGCEWRYQDDILNGFFLQYIFIHTYLIFHQSLPLRAKMLADLKALQKKRKAEESKARKVMREFNMLSDKIGVAWCSRTLCFFLIPWIPFFVFILLQLIFQVVNALQVYSHHYWPRADHDRRGGGGKMQTILEKVTLFVEHLEFFVVMKEYNSLSIIPSSINKYCLTEREMVVYVCFCLWEGYFR